MKVVPKIKKFYKNNFKLVVAFILGLLIAGTGVYAQTVLTSKDLAYDNTNSKLSSTNVKDAIDEVNTKATKKVEEAKKECPDDYVCRVNQFAIDSWATIAANVKAGNASAYQVGDTKEIDMGSLGTHTVRIANTSSCTNGETSETACGFVVEFADIISKHSMNSTGTNVGGWPASEMRTYVNETIYNALPSELQNVIATTTVVSGHGTTSGETNFISNDKLYLLSTKEIYNGGTGYDTAEEETRQLDYYSSLGTTKSNYSGAKKQYKGSKSPWWMRGATSLMDSSFCIVNNKGGWASIGAHNANGVSPAFRIA